MKFIEYVGNASTTASIDGVKIGRSVSVAAYSSGDEIVLKLENNGARIPYIKNIKMTQEQYDSFCEKQSRALFARAIELFGAEVWL